jgi:hypothetical protein
MRTDRQRLYRFPWSKTDNPGGWVDVTDVCNLHCPQCYRTTIEGHRPLAEVLADITACREMTNCDDMKIAGGEPLTYPHLIDVVKFVAENGMKPFLLTNGIGLDRALAKELARAGLKIINFHIDSGQSRPGWKGRTEAELNDLRQAYVDMVAGLKGLGCGFNMTISPVNLGGVPDVLEWAMQNIRTVRHLTLIVLRGIGEVDNVAFFAKGQRLPAELVPNRTNRPDLVHLTSEDILKTIRARFPEITPCGYLNGAAFPETKKYLVSVLVASRRNLYGCLGPQALELSQVAIHLAKGRYVAIMNRSKVGRTIFLFSTLDTGLRKALAQFLKISLVRPWRAFDSIYLQTISIEQPLELIDGEPNVCDDCINMMVFKGRLIPSCRVEEYRRFQGPVVSQKIG